MNWKKKIREIEKRNPDGLHPLIKQAEQQSGSVHAWDAVRWHNDSEVSLEAAARPIIFVLKWLDTLNMLNTKGKKVLREAERGEVENLEISPSLVSYKVYKFLSEQYEEWYATYGINMAINEGYMCDTSSLDDAIAKYKI